MKAFEFRLERVRQFREKQLTLEESKLEGLLAELTQIEQQAARLDQDHRHNEKSVIGARSVSATELRAIDSFRQYVRIQHHVLAERRSDSLKRIEAQRNAILEARRKFELLNRLKDRRLQVWRAAMDLELELQATESYLAKWNASQSKDHPDAHHRDRTSV
jgi:hypothetical protein